MRNSTKIAIYHFNPLELYPPVMNFLHALALNLPGNTTIKVFTSALVSGHMVFHLENNNIQIIRLGRFQIRRNALNRLVHYLQYYIITMLNSLLWQPNRVLYFETLSAFPVCCLTRVFKKMTIFAYILRIIQKETKNKIQKKQLVQLSLAILTRK